MFIKAIFQITTILLVSSIAALVANTIRPDSLPWIIDTETSVNPGDNKALEARVAISLEDLRRHLDDGSAFVVDARKVEQYEEGHISGAINIPSAAVEDYVNLVYEILPLEELVIVYCEGGDCESSNVVFEFLVNLGYETQFLRIFKPGWEAISDIADFPVSYGSE